MSIVFEINGKFDDQKGTVRMGRITGYAASGIPFRKYTWVNPKIKSLKGKSFEATDTQIDYGISKVRKKSGTFAKKKVIKKSCKKK
jgi:hypothetical protein